MPGEIPQILGATDPEKILELTRGILNRKLYARLADYQGGIVSDFYGPPTTGNWTAGDVWRDIGLALWFCTVSGTPGTWKQIEAGLKDYPGGVGSGGPPNNPPNGYLAIDYLDDFRLYRLNATTGAWVKLNEWDADAKIGNAELAAMMSPSIKGRPAGTTTGQPQDLTAAQVAAILQTYFDAKLNLSGGTMTGKITLDGNPTANLHAATKQYVDALAGAGGYTRHRVAYCEPTGGNNGTALVGDPSKPFASAQAAVEALLALSPPLSAGDPAVLFVGAGDAGNIEVEEDLKGLSIVGVGRHVSFVGDVLVPSGDAIELCSDGSVKIGDIKTEQPGGSTITPGDITLRGRLHCQSISANGANGDEANPDGTPGGNVNIDDTVVHGNCSTIGGTPYDDSETEREGQAGGCISGLRNYVSGIFSAAGGAGVNGGSNGADGDTSGVLASYIAGGGWTG